MRAALRVLVGTLLIGSLSYDSGTALASGQVNGWLAAGLCPTHVEDDRLPSTPWTGSVGVGASFKASPHRVIETGLVYERRAQSKFSHFATDGEYRYPYGFERRLELDYLRLPIRLRVPIGSGRVMPSLHAGVEGALQVPPQLISILNLSLSVQPDVVQVTWMPLLPQPG